MINELLPYTVIVPVVAAVVTLGLNKPLGRWNGLIAFLALLPSIGVFGASTYCFFTGLVAKPYEVVYDWVLIDVARLKFGFRADFLSSPVALTIAIVSALIALYTIKYMEHSSNMGIFSSLYLLFFVGMVGLVLSTNLIEFFVFFEITLIASWALINEWGEFEKEKIALKYFIFTEAGALCFLAGIVATNGYLGTLEIHEIPQRIIELIARPGVGWSILVAIVSAMLIGLFVKMAVFPLHAWLPDAHVAAPTPVSALLSPVMIGLAGYAILRIVLLYTPTLRYISMAMIVLAVITMVYGALNAFTQEDFKRLLAYSSISQMGYVLLGLGATALAMSNGHMSLAIIGVAGSMLHFVAHALGKAILFLLSGVFDHQAGTRSISRLGGLAGRMPYTSVAMFVGFFTIMGVPFTSGFISEWMIFTSAIGSASLLNDAFKISILIVAIVATALTFAYALWAIRRMLFGQLPPHLNEVREAPFGLLAPLAVMALISIALGLYPAVFVEVLAKGLG